MLKILVPTDFSAHSHNAIQYAIGLANATGASITLLHTYKAYNTAGMFMSVESFMESDAKEEMNAVLERYRPKLKRGLKLYSRILKGDAISMICNYAAIHRFDLILMGTQGATGLKEVFIGSMTNSVLKQTIVPVLVIPENCQFQSIQYIVLAIDDEKIQEEAMFNVLVQLTQALFAHILIFHQDDGDEDWGVDSNIRTYLQPVGHSLHLELKPSSFEKSIKAFVEEKKADLLTMVRRKRGMWESLFHFSATSQEVFETEVPLLVLVEL